MESKLIEELRAVLDKYSVQPPNAELVNHLLPINMTRVLSSVGINIHVNEDGSHKHGNCRRYGKNTTLVGKCSVKEGSYQFCPICGNTDVEIIKEDLKPFGE